ncbi:LysR family transcriptional regulator [Microbacterium elymi]|uniref:LysR family transcriptional regulator n=1 Tax=Microbacterium elymi TaxID=2909587 RepID=A0ABY5NI64_9MICO|nr:LysR family transcriptional regulator [Microbacterium elymi]UUT34855.1 LysR family transcriptional regulator [Microbacterium elymi]
MDLNLVRVFVAIYETRSLTTAAGRLFVTQPAVSQALGRLRRELDDPLFERNGRQMEPTALAAGLFPGFREAIAGIDRTLDAVHGFEPAQSQKLFRIALSELGEIGWMPAILAAVRAQAPGMRIEAVPMDAAALPDWLARGVVDLAVTPSPCRARSTGSCSNRSGTAWRCRRRTRSRTALSPSTPTPPPPMSPFRAIRARPTSPRRWLG